MPAPAPAASHPPLPPPPPPPRLSRRVLDRMAASALRVLAFAVKTEGLGDLGSYDGSEGHAAHRRLADPSQYAAIESDLAFVGLAGLQDPPRPEVRGAIEACGAAGIRVVVITGDNKLTAEAICRDIGVFEEGQDLGAASLTGMDFMALPEAKKLAMLGQTVRRWAAGWRARGGGVGWGGGLHAWGV